MTQFDFFDYQYSNVRSLFFLFYKVTANVILSLCHNRPTSRVATQICVGVTMRTVIKFDKRLAKQYRELNKIENDISAKIFDVISNITTVIILKLERKTEV